MKSPTANVLLSAALFLTLAPLHAAEDQWTRFRGPNGTGLSDATTVPVQWTEKDYNWKVRLPGAGHSSPVVWDRRVFLTSSDAETGRRSVLCLDSGDGRVLWQRDYPSKTYGQHGDNSYASATPAVDADGVVVTWTTPDEVLLLALDLEGREVWRRPLGPFVGARGSGTSPIIVGDLVVLANDQEDPNLLPENRGKPGAEVKVGKSFLIAMDRKTGKTRWQLDRRTGIAAYSTPCARRAHDGRPELIVTSTGHGLTGVDLATGKVNWEVDGIFPDRCVASPVLADDLVIAGYGLGMRGTRWVAVRPKTAAQGGETKIAYDLSRATPLVPTPLVKDGRLFLWCDDGVVSCLQASSGDVLWRERVQGGFYSSPVCVGDRIYCVAKNGDVVVLAAADKFELLARVPLGEACYATPAVAGGVMYLRTHEHLISLGGKR